jgi:hypothetical protein
VVDVWEADLSSEDASWMIMVDHGDFEFAYTPNELSLIPTNKDNNLVLVNFKTKQRRV